MEKIEKLAPIVLFVYNRLDHTKQTVEALKKNRLAEESELFIFSDAPKDEATVEKVNEVREYIKTISGFKKLIIRESSNNKGCDCSIIDGVTEIINLFGKIIVLEDDILTTNNFLEYMNKGLDFYKDIKTIAGITGYTPEIKINEQYFNKVYVAGRGSSWGWGTWNDRWKEIDWNMNDYEFFKKSSKMQNQFNKYGNDMTKMLINAMENEPIPYWDIRRCFNMFINNKKFIYPTVSKVKNIGLDGSGIHCANVENRDIKLDTGEINIVFIKNLKEDERVIKEFKNFFSPKGFISRVYKKISFFLKRSFI